jgi:hypothetical protein
LGIDVCLNGEVQHYRDEGCAVHPSCLHCPAPRCLEEAPRDKQRARTANRAAGMAALRDQGVPPREIARRFHISLRTVQRGLNLMKRMAPPHHPSSEGED